MITVEGLDGTGKTTLVERLMKEFPGLHHRPSIGNKHNMMDIRNQAEAEAFQFGPNVISDRSRIISEFVYHPIMGDRDTAYPLSDWLRYIESWVQRPQLLIYCIRPMDKLEADLDASDVEQLAGVRENLSELNYGYAFMMELIDWLFKLSPRGHYLVTYTFDNLIPAGGHVLEGFDPYDPVKETVEKFLKANV